MNQNTDTAISKYYNATSDYDCESLKDNNFDLSLKETQNNSKTTKTADNREFCSYDLFGNSAEIVEDNSEILYSTHDLATMFNVSGQTIRNTDNYFREFLSDERRSDGRRYYTSQDIEVIKMIFKMNKVQKYSRRDIREYFLRSGLSNNAALNKSNENNMTASIPETMQPRINEALSTMQTAVLNKISEGLSIVEKRMYDTMVQAMQNNAKEIVESIDLTRDELKTLIIQQKDIIKSQNEEITKLRSSLHNINRTATEIDKAIKNFDVPSAISESDLEKLTQKISSMISTSSINSNPEYMSNTLDIIKSTTQNNAKQLKSEIQKQNNTLGQIEESLTKLLQNNVKDSQKSVKSDFADIFNRNYQKLEKILKGQIFDHNKELTRELLKAIDSLKETGSFNNFDAVSKEIEQLKNLNNDLCKKAEISKTIISKQNDEISALKRGYKDVDTDNKKLEVANQLISKLTLENDKLREKARISEAIINKQEKQLELLDNDSIKSNQEPKKLSNTAKESLKSFSEDNLFGLLL